MNGLGRNLRRYARRSATTRCARLAAAAIVLTAAAAGCAVPIEDFGEHDHGPGIPAGASVQPLPPLPSPWQALDRADPAAVAIAAVKAVFDWHPELGDTGPEIAAQRAEPLFTARAADRYRPYPMPRSTWEDWMSEGATTSAETTIGAEEHPADTAGTWQRKTTTTLTITVPGRTPRALTVISLVTAQKQPVWMISDLAHLATA